MTSIDAPPRAPGPPPSLENRPRRRPRRAHESHFATNGRMNLLLRPRILVAYVRGCAYHSCLLLTATSITDATTSYPGTKRPSLRLASPYQTTRRRSHPHFPLQQHLHPQSHSQASCQCRRRHPRRYFWPCTHPPVINLEPKASYPPKETPPGDPLTACSVCASPARPMCPGDTLPWTPSSRGAGRRIGGTGSGSEGWGRCGSRTRWRGQGRS